MISGCCVNVFQFQHFTQNVLLLYRISKGGECMITKRKLVSLATTLILLGGTLSVTMPAYAASGNNGGGNFFSGLIQFIAQKFGLDQNQVKSAVTDYQQQRKATITPRPTLSPQAMQDQEKKRLNNLVSQGKITTDQENAILAELAALRAKYPFNAQQTPDQRKTQMQNMQNDLKAWAQANNIDFSIVWPMGMRGGFGGGFRGGKRGSWKPTPTVTPGS